MDLRFEAAAENELKNNTKNDKNFVVPEIFWDYTSKRVLTLKGLMGYQLKILLK